MSPFITLLLIRLTTPLAHTTKLEGRLGRRDERGDVPGWVLVTVMSAGIVGVLWQFSSAELQAMLAEALASVTG